MKKVLVINPEVGVDVRNRLSKKFGPGFSLSYVQDYAGDDAKAHILSSIIESEFLVLVVIPDASNEPQEWIIKEANRLGKRIIIVFLAQEEIPVPEIVSDYADATVNIESASFGKVIGGGDVFEDPDMKPAASKTRPRSQC